MTKVKLDHAHVGDLLRGMIRIRRFGDAGMLRATWVTGRRVA